MHSVLSCKLATTISIFPHFSWFQVKMVNHYQAHVIFQDTEHQL